MRPRLCPDRHREALLLSESYLVSSVLLQLLVELQRDADHHFGLVPVGVGDVVQHAIKICGAYSKRYSRRVNKNLSLKAT